MDEQPIFGITLEQYRSVLTKAGATQPSEAGVSEAAAALGLDAKKWKFAAPKWADRIAKAGSSGAGDQDKAGGENLPAYVEPSLSLDALIDVSVRIYQGEDAKDVYARHAIDEAAFTRAREEWTAAFPHRMRDYMRYGLMCYRASNVKPNEQFRKKKRGGAGAPAMATRVRARRCSQCGAHKRTVHSRPWIHCDMCGALFDYDLHARTPGQSVLTDYSRETLDTYLGKETKPKDATERAAYDKKAQRWIHDVLVEVTPWDYPARIGDQAYRDAYLDQWLLPAEKTLRESDEYQASWREMVIADRNLPKGKQSFETVKTYYDLTQRHLDVQVKLLGEAGLFEKHPDTMTPDLYRRSRISVFVEGWVGSMKPGEAEKLVAHSGMREEFIDPPAVATANAGCGRCGSPLVVIQSATRVVCEDCGAMADATKTYSCRACGGGMLSTADDGHLPDTCSHCGVKWESV